MVFDPTKYAGVIKTAKKIGEVRDQAIELTHDLLFGKHEDEVSPILPDWITNKHWNPNNRPVSDFQKPIYDEIEITPGNHIRNTVYVSSNQIYQTTNIFIEDSGISKPGSLLPVEQGQEVDNQTPTKVVIGAPITLSQSVTNQRFGRLLHNPFSQTEREVRQIKDNEVKSKLKELEDQGLDKFARLLAGDPDSNVFDSFCLVAPVSLRGMYGANTLLFGSSSLKYIAAMFNASSLNALQGVHDDISTSYKVVEQQPSYEIAESDFQGVSIKGLSNENIEKIYQILGGDSWEVTEEGTLMMTVEPESLLKNVGAALYTQDSATLTALTVTNLLELHTAFCSVDFHRSGHHRLPATVLTSLQNTPEGNATLQIFDLLSFQEWMVNQLDGLIGEFPLKIKHKTLNDQNKLIESEMVLNNVTEAMAEFMALTLNIAQDSDTAINIGMKGLVESMKASNAAISTYDYAVANSKYLGYKGNDKEREIDLTFTPGASNLADALKPSKKKIVGWENEDNETLVELIKKTLIGTEIVKASLFHPFQPDDKVTGDAIKEDLEEQKTETEAKWEQFKQRVGNPSGRYVVPKPKAKIKDLTIDPPNQE